MYPAFLRTYGKGGFSAVGYLYGIKTYTNPKSKARQDPVSSGNIFNIIFR